jgi:hypothetical protein
MAAKKKWIITVAGSRSVNAVKKDIAAAGFEIDQVFAEIGCITGLAKEAVAKKIKGIEGVTDVSPEAGDIDIGQPGDPLTW